MKQIIFTNTIGQITIKPYEKLKLEKETPQEFLDRVNKNIDHDEEFLTMSSLDLEDYNSTAKKNILSRTNNKDINNIIKDLNVITMLDYMAAEKNDRKTAMKILDFKSGEIIDSIYSLRDFMNVRALHKASLDEVYEAIKTAVPL